MHSVKFFINSASDACKCAADGVAVKPTRHMLPESLALLCSRAGWIYGSVYKIFKHFMCIVTLFQ